MKLDKDLCSIQEVRNLLRAAKEAEDQLNEFSQAQVDRVVDALREAGESNACYLADMAIKETGMGKYEDKCFKNYFASRYVYNHIKDMKTVGIINEDKENRTWEIAEPMGVIAGIVPTTNPTSTVIYKSLIAIKCRNTIVFSPHPSAVKCTMETARVMHQAAVSAGAPEGSIGCLSMVSMGATTELMKHPSTSLILATGGSSLVKAAYSSGKPALGVGPGNVPVFVEKSADLAKAAKCIVRGKTFDNGTICASEQAVVVEECIADELIKHLKRNGAHFLDQREVKKVSKVVMLPNNAVNPKVVGKSPQFIAELAGINVPDNVKCMVTPLEGIGPQWPLSYEKLSPIIAFYTVADWHEGCKRCLQLINSGGLGHSLAIHSENEDIIREFALKKPIFRVLINTPAALGGVGATTGLAPSFTLGSGTWGGSSVSENVSAKHLLNIKKVAWQLKEPESIAIEDMKKDECKRNENQSVDTELLYEVVSRVIREMKLQE